MRNKQLVSIIIPVYNAEETIQKTVNSVSKQTYEYIEIILVNDGSKDNSPILCDKLAINDERIRVIHIPNKGVANARNVGIEYSSGEFIAFVDSDDLIDSDMIEVFLKIMSHYDVDFIISPFKRQMMSSNIIINYDMNYSGFYKDDFRENVIFDYYFGVNRNKFLGSCCGKLFKSNILKEKRIVFDTNLNYGEDNLFVFEYLMIGKSFYVVTNYYPYTYIIHDNSATSKIEKDLFARRKYEIEKYIQVLGSRFKQEYNKI